MTNMKYEMLPGGGRIPRLGIGTWRMGGDMSPDYNHDDQIAQAIHSALEIGYNHIDTAEMYGGGHTEELVGKALRGFKRTDLFITSKVWWTHLRYKDVLEALQGSLLRLGTDYLDLYLIHWPNPDIPLEETFRGLNEAIKSGKVRRIGVSNFDVALMKQASALSETPLATNQVPYSLGNRDYAKNGVLEHCQAEGITLTAYSPIDKGSVVKNQQVKEVSARSGATPAQVALAWLLRQPGVIAIPKASSLKHLEENLGALEVELTQEDATLLEG